LKCNQIAGEPDQVVKILMLAMKMAVDVPPLAREVRTLGVHQRIEEHHQPLVGPGPPLSIQREVVTISQGFGNNTESLGLVAGRLLGLVETALVMRNRPAMVMLKVDRILKANLW